MKYFWIHPRIQFSKTYRDLIDDLNARTTHRKYQYSANPYQVLLGILTGLITGEETHLLDAEFTPTELQNLGISSDALTLETPVNKPNIKNINHLFELMAIHRDEDVVVMYTSGTTGRPKRVFQSLANLKRTVKTAPKFRNDVWGFAYNLTHFAGIQVFLQAFYNQNTLVNIFDLDGPLLPEILEKYRVTCISATPTFYRKMLSVLNYPLLNVQRVTLGGEKYDPALVNDLQSVFPNARFRNIYASTEAGALFSSHGDIFVLDDKLKSLVQINSDGELLVHRSLLGKFESSAVRNDWFHTGDMVELIGENRYRFVSRKNEMINVGGYKVNPHEVEEEIKKIEGVIDVLVKSRLNRITGNILLAEIVKKNGFDSGTLEKTIFRQLSERLQPYKVPRIFKFVPHLELTRTGKKGRV